MAPKGKERGPRHKFQIRVDLQVFKVAELDSEVNMKGSWYQICFIL